jgi:hypothetical protein
MEERNATRRASQQEALKNELIELETQKRLLDMQKQTEIARREIRKQLASDNQTLAQETRNRVVSERAKEGELNSAELASNARSRMINEHLVPRSQGTMDYRGMTVEEQKTLIDEQAKQMQDREQRRANERKKEKEWEEYQESLRVQADLREAKWRREMAEERKKLSKEHLQQAAEVKTRERVLNKDVYGANVPDESYHAQWAHDVR